MSFELKNLEKSIVLDENILNSEIEALSNKDIAVIGLSCRFADADNKEMFWNSLKNGEDHIRQFPQKRKHYGNMFLKFQDRFPKGEDYFEGGFLKEVDKFDNQFFSISPMEASLMSPNQRMFLETAWSAIEDAGYGADRLLGSNIGVYLGHSTDFGVSYKEFIEVLNPELASFSISGNLNSLIASRISFLKDFKGPCLTVDTACSSSLAAIHTACKAIRNGDSDMALVGASKIDILPLKSIKAKEDELGITSSDGRARTFDNTSDGTGLGEGIGVILLKPLAIAQKDGDHVYAVIKGTAMNQDGNSVNLTAPNPKAQEEVIIKAWKDGGINPETVSYIEAHGTGTRLGDPIEVKGIENAFRKYTERKQFCGIGSVKSNIGHLDNAAGMAGIIKCILALEKKEIPPSIHFKSPNRNISFEKSPVYVNDIHRTWETSGYPRRCGVSAFGLSGTNCHVILEEAQRSDTLRLKESEKKPRLLSLSAKRMEGILELIREYRNFFESHPYVDLNNVCYTANTGRGHYSHRLAIVFNDLYDLTAKLERVADEGLEGLGDYSIYYGNNNTPYNRESEEVGSTLYEGDKEKFSRLANEQIKKILDSSISLSIEDLAEVAKSYVKGVEINWDLMHLGEVNEKLSLPTYPYSRNSHWIEAVELHKVDKDKGNEDINHPLIKSCILDSFDKRIYLSELNVEDYWILNEHRVANIPVVPGTVYIEMITEIIKKQFWNQCIHLEDIVFLDPLSLEGNDRAKVHIEVRNVSDELEFVVASKVFTKHDWKIHAKGRIILTIQVVSGALNLDEIRNRCKQKELIHYPYEKGKGIELSERWKCIEKSYVGDGEVLAYIKMKSEYINELEDYTLHPALLDEAVNISLRSIGKGLYLPLSYKEITIFRRLPARLFSHVKYKNTINQSSEFAVFDVTLTDEFGNEIVRIKDYIIKRANPSAIKRTSPIIERGFHQLKWIQKEIDEPRIRNNDSAIAVLKGEGMLSDEISALLRKRGRKVIEIDFNSDFMDNNRELCRKLEAQSITQIVHMKTLTGKTGTMVEADFEAEQSNGLYSLISLVNALEGYLRTNKLEILVLAQYANYITDNQKHINPNNAATFGLGKVIGLENRKLRCRCIDFDDMTDLSKIVEEIDPQYKEYQVAYRNGIRYVQQLDEADVKTISSKAFNVRENGVYVITGGTGGIGLEIAHHLSSKGNINLALLNRSKFPSAYQWDAILSKDTDTKLARKITKLKKIRESGSNLLLYDVDITDIDSVDKVLKGLRDRFGGINGIFHCAGVAGNGFISKRDISAIKEVIKPKTTGTWILDKLTQIDDLDCFVLFSSTSSLIAEPGQGDYTAANIFLDAYGNYRNLSGRKTITINWPAWKEVGMAIDFDVDFEKEVFSPITNGEAMELLDKAIASNCKQVIVGSIDYKNYMNIDFKTLELSPRLLMKYSKRKLNNHGFIAYESQKISNLKDVKITSYHNNVSFSETEIKIANIIGNALGLKELDINDSFLGVGGNSIIAVKVQMDMEKYGVNISIGDLYQYESIKNLAQYIDNGHVEQDGKGLDIDSSRMTNTSGRNKENLILEGIEPFRDVVYRGCFYSAFMPVARYFAKDVLFFMANDLIVYDYFDIECASGISIDYKSGKRFEDITKDANMKINKVKRSNVIVSDLKSSISNGKPVIICIDSFYEPIRKDVYNKEHWPHNLLVYGFDDTREVFNIIEHKNRKSMVYEKRELSYEHMVNCYEGYFDHYKNLDIINSDVNFVLYNDLIEFPTYFEFDAGADNNQNLISNAKKIFCENLINNETVLIDGLNKLVEYRKTFTNTVYDETQLKEGCDRLLKMLNTIISGRLVEEYRLKHLLKEYPGITNKIGSILDRWRDVRNGLLKYHYSQKYVFSDMKNICELFVEACNLEKDFYRELFENIRKDY